MLASTRTPCMDTSRLTCEGQPQHTGCGSCCVTGAWPADADPFLGWGASGARLRHRQRVPDCEGSGGSLGRASPKPPRGQAKGSISNMNTPGSCWKCLKAQGQDTTECCRRTHMGLHALLGRPVSQGPTTLGRLGCRATVRGLGVAPAPACPTWRVPGEVHGGLALHRTSALSEFHHTRQGDRCTASSAGAL